MVKTRVVVNGNLQTGIESSYEVLVYGKVMAIVFIKDECIDMMLNKDKEKVSTFLFVGKDFQVVYKSETAIIFSGDVEKIAIVNDKGNVVTTYKVNNCETRSAFTEIQ